MGLLLWMDAIGVQDIRAVTILYPCCRNAFGGQEWPIRCDKPIKTCVHCLQHDFSLSKVPYTLLWPPFPLDLLHVHFTSIETTFKLNKSPKVANILVFQDHFTKHVLAYVTPNQTAKTIVSSCIRVTSWSLGPWPGSWVTGVLTLWAVSSIKCARSLAWKNCGPCHTTCRLKGRGRDCTKP